MAQMNKWVVWTNLEKYFQKACGLHYHVDLSLSLSHNLSQTFNRLFLCGGVGLVVITTNFDIMSRNINGELVLFRLK